MENTISNTRKKGAESMKKVFKLASLLTSIILLASAECAADNTVNKFVANGVEVELLTSAFASAVDNSELTVKVVKRQGSSETVVYRGKLGEYDGGQWKNVDFSNIPYFIVCDWWGENPGVYYIVPLDLYAQAVSGAVSATLAQEELSADVGIVYDGAYNEKILKPQKELLVPVSINNPTSVEKTVVLYVAKYDEDGYVTGFEASAPVSVSGNSSAQTSVGVNVSSADASIGIFVWEKNSIRPVKNKISLSSVAGDYYGNTVAEANKIELSRNICGFINTATDIDILKITPTVTGTYAIKLSGTLGTSCRIFDSENETVTAAAITQNNDYAFCNLTSGETYYISFTGANNASYTLEPTQASDIASTSLNTAALGTLSESNTYDVFSFEPSGEGDYIFTAVGANANVRAELYNADFEKIGESDTGDAYVSFRITKKLLTNDEQCYIMVIGKNDQSANSYTLYVEQPLEIVSAQ